MPFISTNDKHWQNMLTTAEHDFYHLPGFAETEAWLLGGEPLAWWMEQDGQQHMMPLVKRQVAGTNYSDLVSPYGYPGLLSSASISKQQAIVLFNLFNQEAASSGYISSFIRLNPFNNNWDFNRPGGASCSFKQHIHGKTVSIDLTPSLELIRRNFSENHKRNLRQLSEHGSRIAINNWSLMNDFMVAYRQTMKRKRALPYYFFPDTYFELLRRMLGERLILITINNAGGTLLAGGLFTLTGRVMQYHLGATADEVVKFSPSKLMMDSAIVFGKEHDAEVLHVGGGFSASTSDGLFRFKKGFGSDFHSFSTLRFIHHADIYNELTRGKAVGVGEFFPAYRDFGMRKV